MRSLGTKECPVKTASPTFESSKPIRTEIVHATRSTFQRFCMGFMTKGHGGKGSRG